MKTNYVLIDLENVTPEHLALLNKDNFRVYVFVGANQPKIPLPIVKAVQSMGERAQYIEISGAGPNALDFHIAFYIGQISIRDENAYFHILSKDTGFDPLIAHLKQNHLFADRVTKILDIPALNPEPFADQSLDERKAYAKSRILLPNATRPRKCQTLLSHLVALFHNTLSDKDVNDIMKALFKDGFVREKGTRLVYEDEPG